MWGKGGRQGENKEYIFNLNWRYLLDIQWEMLKKHLGNKSVLSVKIQDWKIGDDLHMTGT